MDFVHDTIRLRILFANVIDLDLLNKLLAALSEGEC